MRKEMMENEGITGNVDENKGAIFDNSRRTGNVTQKIRLLSPRTGNVIETKGVIKNYELRPMNYDVGVTRSEG
jgi:hypothetical protein